jgi:peptidoglycan pentaglycine glycine transferase (the first glycine)
LAVGSPLGEAFQSHAWGELKSRYGWTPLRSVVQTAGRPVAVVSVLERPVVRLPLLRGLRVHYAPRGPVLLDETPEAAEMALAAVREIARRRRSVMVTLDPNWEEGGSLDQALGRSGFTVAAKDVQVSRTGMVVPLEPSEDVQRGLLGHTTWQDVTKAVQMGVVVERVALDDPAERETAMADFYRMHAETGEREGFIVRDREYELEQWRLLGASGVASLWFAGVNGRDTGALLLRSGALLVYFAAGSRDGADMRKTRANHLLQWRIIRWAAENGFSGYDMGGVDTPTAPGVPQDESHPLWNLFLFKRRFGGRPVVRVRAHEYAPGALTGAAWRLARRFR